MEDLNGIRTRAKVRHGQRAVLYAGRSLLQTSINMLRRVSSARARNGASMGSSLSVCLPMNQLTLCSNAALRVRTAACPDLRDSFRSWADRRDAHWLVPAFLRSHSSGCTAGPMQIAFSVAGC